MSGLSITGSCIGSIWGPLLVGGAVGSITVFDVQDEQLSHQRDDPGRPRRVGRETKAFDKYWIQMKHHILDYLGQKH